MLGGGMLDWSIPNEGILDSSIFNWGITDGDMLDGGITFGWAPGKDAIEGNCTTRNTSQMLNTTKQQRTIEENTHI